MKPVGWSKERGFYYDPDGFYYHRQDVEALLKLLEVDCTCRYIEMCDRCEAIDDYRAQAKQRRNPTGDRKPGAVR